MGPIDRNYQTVNVYLLGEHEIVAGRLRVHAGLTFYADSLFGSRFTPKLGLVWTPGAGTVAKLVYAEGFRPPTPGEAFFEDGTSFIANAGLRPEVVRSLDASVEHRFGGVASVQAGLFVNDYRDLISYTVVPAPGLDHVPDPAVDSDWRQQATNTGEDTLIGAQVGLNARFGPRLRAYGGLSLQRSEHRRENSPALTGNVALATSPVAPLTLAVHASFVGPRDGDLDDHALVTRVGPSVQLGAAVTLELPAPAGSSLQLSGTNLLGRRDPSPLPADYLPVTSLPEPPRTFRMVLRWVFE